MPSSDIEHPKYWKKENGGLQKVEASMCIVYVCPKGPKTGMKRPIYESGLPSDRSG